jgi:hypothetical protein
MKTNVISMRKQLRLARQSSVFKPAATKAQHKLAQTWEQAEKSSLESKNI